MVDVAGAIQLIFDEASENRVLARLNEFPDDLQKRLEDPIKSITAEMLALVLAAEPVRTGALHDATQSFVDIRDNLIRGRVRVLSPPNKAGQHNTYAGALEYGAHGRTAVAAHEMTLDHVFDESIPAEQVMVAAYSRDVNITERRFLRDALGNVAAEFEIEVQKAITELAGSFFLAGVAT